MFNTGHCFGDKKRRPSYLYFKKFTLRQPLDRLCVVMAAVQTVYVSKDTDNVILQIHCRLIDFDEAKKFKNHDCCKRNICQIYKPLLITDSEDTIYRVSVKNILLDHQGGCCYPGVGILLKTNTPGGLQKRPKAGNLRWFFVLTRICLVTRGD